MRLYLPIIVGLTGASIFILLCYDIDREQHSANVAELERRRFNEVERWSAERVVRWVEELDGGRYAALAPCFGGCTGKALSLEWLGHITKRVVAQGGSAEDASEIYEAFHRLHRRAKAKAKRAPASGGADADEQAPPGAPAVNIVK